MCLVPSGPLFLRGSFWVLHRNFYTLDLLSWAKNKKKLPGNKPEVNLAYMFIKAIISYSAAIVILLQTWTKFSLVIQVESVFALHRLCLVYGRNVYIAFTTA